MEWQISGGAYPYSLPSGTQRTRSTALYPPKNARPFMLSNPLRFVNVPDSNSYQVIAYDVPLGYSATVNRMSLKCHPQFAGIFPSPWWTITANGSPIADGTQQIYADLTQVRNAFFYVPPVFNTVQWQMTGPCVFYVGFTQPIGNGNSHYLYTAFQGFTYPTDGAPLG
jgi:hypothetical protein